MTNGQGSVLYEQGYRPRNPYYKLLGLIILIIIVAVLITQLL